jgi:hypothetical protein
MLTLALHVHGKVCIVGLIRQDLEYLKNELGNFSIEFIPQRVNEACRLPYINFDENKKSSTFFNPSQSAFCICSLTQ